PAPTPRIVRSKQITSDGRQKFGSIVTDGSRLYFLEDSHSSWARDLAAVTTTGAETARITTPFQEGVWLADISPDGDQLLIANARPGDWLAEKPVWLLPALGGTPHRLGDVVATDATWTPDGERSAYSRGSDIFMVDRAGEQSHQLTSVSGILWWLRWSPDGRRLRFTRFDPKTSSSSLWEVDADGIKPHVLLQAWNDPGDMEYCGNWTPDGKYFV